MKSMRLRILKVGGRSEQARLKRLAVVRAWMEGAGWQLMDFSPEAGSAAFERDGAAQAMSRFHPTVWLPGPDWYKPYVWLNGGSGMTRLGVVAGLVGIGVVMGLLGALYISHTSSEFSTVQADQPEEAWQFVNASMLNVRDMPIDGAQIVGVLYRNQRVEVKRVDDGWAEIIRPERGFVVKKYLQEHPSQ